MIALARKTLVYEWRRFVPSIFAVGFAGVLLVMQVALVLGIFSTAAIYVNASSADLWVGYPGTQSVNYGRAIDQDVEMRLRMDPDIAEVEPYLWLDGDWRANDPGEDAMGGVSVYLSGISPTEQGMLFDRVLAPWQRQLLREPGAVIVDRADLDTLASKEGDVAWINNHKVRIVAVVNGLRGLGGVNVIGSLASVREIADVPRAQGTTYLLARTRAGADAKQVQQRLNAAGGSFGPAETWLAKEFALRSEMYWMFNTGAGAGVLFMAIVVCLVGAVVTSQSLRTVVAGSAREYAVLNALGVSRGALGRVVVEQAFWIGAAGMVLALVASAALLTLAHHYQVPVRLNLSAVLACAGLIAVLALFSGIGAMRGLLRAEPAALLR
ncbi:FtsX-like permease family protein [Lampropedia aestuarii]|uniref:FtsX-like permease family protein n=1 Tax=Lampropedia aestuarii TaxID=2562762 RepID=A0A4S5BRW0_9BURK|nr:ABC transporter permease [Lampropedia aestuarii]MDH5856485.1 ABC transporter permease [Lampropedia aestuarii]THJ33973.1 FtsX-like permease family protein [Lampropedia aestuarii]